jgi:hypothetical protein
VPLDFGIIIESSLSPVPETHTQDATVTVQPQFCTLVSGRYPVRISAELPGPELFRGDEVTLCGLIRVQQACRHVNVFHARYADFMLRYSNSTKSACFIWS